MRATIFLLCTALLASPLLTGKAKAAEDVLFLKLEGVPGYVTAPDGRPGAFTILSYAFSNEPAAAAAGTAPPAAEKTPEEMSRIAPASGGRGLLTIVREGDRAAGMFGNACMPGKRYASATLYVKEEQYNLQDATVDGCVTRGNRDTMTLSYAKIEKTRTVRRTPNILKPEDE